MNRRAIICAGIILAGSTLAAVAEEKYSSSRYFYSDGVSASKVHTKVEAVERPAKRLRSVKRYQPRIDVAQKSREDDYCKGERRLWPWHKRIICKG